MKKIGIVGSRSRDTNEDLKKVNDAFLVEFLDGDEIVSGGCPKGGDRFAEILAKMYEVPIEIHYPDRTKLDKDLLKKNPRAAYAVINYARNELIARDSDVLIACVYPNPDIEPRQGGTEDTIRKFKKFHPNGKLVLV